MAAAATDDAMNDRFDNCMNRVLVSTDCNQLGWMLKILFLGLEQWVKLK